jgi:hypothetical protein
VEKLQAIGWEPRRNLSTILDDFLEWVEDIGGIPEPLSDAHFDMKQAGVVLSSANLQTSV